MTARDKLKQIIKDSMQLAALSKRFWFHVDIPENDPNDDLCWIWNGCRKLQGFPYGTIRMGGSVMLAHRVSWIISNQQHTDLDVTHRCDNPPCVRPSHLYPATTLENMQEMAARGRSASGERSGVAVLNWELVRHLRKVYVPHHKQFGARALARQFGLSDVTAFNAIKGRYWRER